MSQPQEATTDGGVPFEVDGVQYIAHQSSMIERVDGAEGRIALSPEEGMRVYDAFLAQE